MTPLGYATLLSLPAVVFLLFAIFPARKAVIYSFLWGWFFLPVYEIRVHGLVEFSKLSATPLSVLAATCIFDLERILSFRPKIWDLPWAVFMLCPFFSSMHNFLGPYDGANAVLNQFYFWGGGYVVGRLYFTDLEGLRELAFAFVLGGLIYVPFCLWEIRMSPQLHLKLYGFAQHQFAQTRRFGGFRPLVFLQHGIALGVWMISTVLASWWLWMCGTFKSRWRISGGAATLVLFITVILCRALEAAVLMLVGMATLLAIKYFKGIFRVVAVLTLALTPPIYTYLRAEEIWSGKQMVDIAAMVNVERSRSLAFRLKNEELILARARQSPVYGWGGWNRFQPQDEYGRPLSVPDQQWIIAFGKTGLIGMISFELMMLLPLLVLWMRVPMRYWSHPGIAPASALAVIAALHMWDCLLNAMVNPMFMMACGAITGMIPVAIKMRNTQRSPRPHQQPSRPMIARPSAPALPAQ